MLRPGLVSITFRKLSPAEVLSAAKAAALEGIEWGADLHVPAGDIGTAARVGEMTRDAGLTVAAYGSYYRVGSSPADEFQRVLDCAIALETKIIRVWPGSIGSAQADDSVRNAVVADARRISALAKHAEIRLACEWHGGTLTDNADSARRLFEEVTHPSFCSYWQPHQRMSFAGCLTDMDVALPRLIGLHVFQWDQKTMERYPLAHGNEVWPAYLKKAAGAGDAFALLEFVKNDSIEQMKADAQTLRQWLSAGL